MSAKSHICHVSECVGIINRGKLRVDQYVQLTEEDGQVALLDHQALQLGRGHVLDLAGNVKSVRRGEEVEDPLRVEEVPLVVESLPHLEEGEGGEVPDAMSLGGLLVVDPDQSDPVPGDLLSDPLEDAQDPLAGLAILGV